MLANDDGSRWALTKPELQLLSRVMSGDPKRPGLHAVSFDRDRRWAAACDGHRALVAAVDSDAGQTSDPAGATYREPVLVPASAVGAAIRAAKSRDTIVFAIDDGPSWRVYTSPGSPWDHSERAVTVDVVTSQGIAGPGGGWNRPAGAIAPPLSQAMPAYDVHPPTEPAACLALNVKYLAEVSQLAKIQPDRTVPVRVWHSSAEDPILLILDTDHGVTWRMIIMPMRL